MHKIAIVILNWNGAKMLRQYLADVIKFSTEDGAVVYVADNASTDDSIELLETHFTSCRIVRLEKNWGFAEGYNKALEQIDTPYTVLLNSDVEVTEGWLNAPLAAMEQDEQLAAVQPKIRAYRDKRYFEYAGAAGGFMDSYGYPFCRGRVLHIVEEDRGQYDQPTDILWATGACLFIRTQLYRHVGGLDAGFFAHQEEIYLCWRLRSRGYRLRCCPESVVYHVGGATLHVESPRKTFLNFRNNLLMLYKNLPENRLQPVMRVRFWLDYLAALKFLLCGHPQNAWAVYEARSAYQALKVQYAPKRQENLRLTRVKEIPEILSKSLIKEFYLHGKRYFPALMKGK